ncbi:MAG: OmpA family protein [Deltaproteobacteria bacterium]|nr:OmpA family protein [Deltaproteobacteria bacterium]
MNRLAFVTIALASVPAVADPTSGVDGALFRSSYDTSGVFALEGARLMPKRDISFKMLLSYAQSPIDVAVPGIGAMPGDESADKILDYATVLDLAFGMSVTDKLAVGFDVAAYRTATSVGYGKRGLYGNGGVEKPSTGIIALRPLSNVDPSASPNDETAYLGDGLAGPLDVRAGIKYNLFQNRNIAVTAVGSVFLPFGEDEMLLGDRGLVFEPKLAFDWRKDQIKATRVVANVSGRFRERSVLEGYDTVDPMQTDADAKVYLDVGSELVVGVGGVFELTPRTFAGLEAQVFVPLPDGATYGSCVRYNGKTCSSIADADYFGDAKHGDLTALVTLGMGLRISADVTANLMIGTGQIGARGDDFRFTSGIVWAPQPAGAAAPGRNDRDGDGVPDSLDGCSEDPEDKDGFQDEDGCPDIDNDGDGIVDSDDQCANEPEDKDGFKDTDGCREDDNDTDSIPDTADKCPDQAEDRDGFEDEDGCLDQDNDGDGFADGTDKCPNDAETVNGVDDDDGCPDVRGTTGPEERADRIDLKGGLVSFAKNTNNLTPAAKQLLNQVAQIIKTRKLTVRIEVHVPLSTKANGAAAIRTAKAKDKTTAQVRARAITDYLVSQGVSPQQLQSVGIGSDRPLGAANATDAANERTDFIKAQQQGGTP